MSLHRPSHKGGFSAFGRKKRCNGACWKYCRWSPDASLGRWMLRWVVGCSVGWGEGCFVRDGRGFCCEKTVSVFQQTVSVFPKTVSVFLQAVIRWSASSAETRPLYVANVSVSPVASAQCETSVKRPRSSARRNRPREPPIYRHFPFLCER